MKRLLSTAAVATLLAAGCTPSGVEPAAPFSNHRVLYTDAPEPPAEPDPGDGSGVGPDSVLMWTRLGNATVVREEAGVRVVVGTDTNGVRTAVAVSGTDRVVSLGQLVEAVGGSNWPGAILSAVAITALPAGTTTVRLFVDDQIVDVRPDVDPVTGWPFVVLPPGANGLHALDETRSVLAVLGVVA